jgi:hypothetical protein
MQQFPPKDREMKNTKEEGEVQLLIPLERKAVEFQGQGTGESLPGNCWTN